MNCCFATVVTKPKYEVAAGRMYQALQYFNSKYPLEILVSDQLIDTDLPFITEHNIPYRKISPLSFKTIKYTTDFQDVRFNDTLSKLLVLTLVDYDRVCFLDADSAIISNIDTFFDDINWEFDSPFYFSITYDDFANKTKISGECLLCKPSLAAYQQSLLYYQDMIDNQKCIMCDEDFFKEYYKNCIYNDSYDFNDKILNYCKKVLHLSGPIKPWTLESGILQYIFYKSPIESYINYMGDIKVFSNKLAHWLAPVTTEIQKIELKYKDEVKC